MHQNLVKIRDREGKLETLMDKGERLEEGVILQILFCLQNKIEKEHAYEMCWNVI